MVPYQQWPEVAFTKSENYIKVAGTVKTKMLNNQFRHFSVFINNKYLHFIDMVSFVCGVHKVEIFLEQR